MRAAVLQEECSTTFTAHSFSSLRLGGIHQPHQIFQHAAMDDTHYRAAFVAAKFDRASVHFHGPDAPAAFA